MHNYTCKNYFIILHNSRKYNEIRYERLNEKKKDLTKNALSRKTEYENVKELGGNDKQMVLVNF